MSASALFSSSMFGLGSVSVWLTELVIVFTTPPNGVPLTTAVLSFDWPAALAGSG